MANNNNLIAGQLVNEIDTLPRSLTGTGTITTNLKWATGVGTKFMTELPADSWIFNGTDQIVRVVRPISDTVVQLDSAFTVELSSVANYKYCNDQECQMKTVTFAVPLGSTDGTFDGAPLRAGRSEGYSTSGNHRTSSADFVNPVILDATSTVIDYRILYGY